MTQDEIIRIAGKAFETPGTEPAYRNGFYTVTPDELEHFAALVAAAEREACAKLCGDLADSPENSEHYRMGANYCRERILARGNT